MITLEDCSMLDGAIEDLKPYKDYNLQEELKCLTTIKAVVANCIFISLNIKEITSDNLVSFNDTIQKELGMIDSISHHDLMVIKSLGLKTIQQKDNINMWFDGIVKVLRDEITKCKAYIITRCNDWDLFCEKEKEYSSKEVKCVNKICDNSVADELDFSFLCRNQQAIESSKEYVGFFRNKVDEINHSLVSDFTGLQKGMVNLQLLTNYATNIDSSITKAVGLRIKNAEDLLETVLNYKNRS